jgi:hypothetical protein
MIIIIILVIVVVRRCFERKNCAYFTIDPSQNMCFLKRADNGKKYRKHLISGKVIRGH